MRVRYPLMAMESHVTDRDQFERQLHDALTRLYDAPYLEQHPLARWVKPSSPTESPGRVLRRLLLEAIQDLKPPPDARPDTLVASRYKFLYLRYVQGQSIAEIAGALSVTERQVFRRQHEAVKALADVLWQRLHIPSAGVTLGEGAPTPREGRSIVPVDSDLRSEVDRIGKAEPRGPTDLAQVVCSALATVGNLAHANRRRISLEVQAGLPPVNADRTAVRQAVLSLLSFAIDSSDEAEIGAELVAGSERVYLCVRLSPRAGSLASDEQGDGNLGVSRRLVELQGGSFQCQESGNELQITVALPAAHPRTVLIVDDNPDTLRLFTRYLEGQPYRVVAASTGEEAMRGVAATRPDVVILDVMLPSADGWEVLHFLRGHPGTEHTPVVVCTVLKQQELARSLGATECLVKPVTRGALLAALERCQSSAG